MAFATSNLKIVPLSGGVRLIVGDWSSAVGDVAGTIGIAAGRVYDATFNANTASGGGVGTATQPYIRWSYSQSGSILTLTLYHQEAVTGGTFCIVCS